MLYKYGKQTRDFWGVLFLVQSVQSNFLYGYEIGYSQLGPRASLAIREFKITTTATATGTSLNKRFNEQNNSCARAL